MSELETLKQKREALRMTAAAPVIDEKIAALENGETTELDEETEEKIAALEQKRDALRNTVAAGRIEEKIAALKEAN